MKTKLSGLLLTLTLLLNNSAHAQTGNPAPYCASAFSNNYNMVRDVSIAGTTFSVGQAGSWMSTNSYTFFNNAAFPSLTVSASSSIGIGFYSAQDMEPRYFALWIDYDNNNTFDATELIMNNANTTNQELPTFTQASVTITKTFTVPANTAPGVKRVRLVRAVNPQNPYGPYTAAFTPSACNSAGGNNYGCTYDFSVNIVAGITVVKPVAQFSANVTNTAINTVVQLTDMSTNNPTSWQWAITPGTGVSYTNATSNTSQNPRVRFTVAGTYTVNLVASNSAGSHTITKTSYIKIYNPAGIAESGTPGLLVTLYPNPTSNYLKVETDGQNPLTRLQVFDVAGRTLLDSDTNLLNVGQLPAGLYFVRAETVSGASCVKQFIKE